MVTAKAQKTQSFTVQLPAKVVRQLQKYAADVERSPDDLAAQYLSAGLQESAEELAAIDEGLKDLDEGRVVNGDVVHARLRARIASHRKSSRR